LLRFSITGTGTGTKWDFYINGGIHAREWIAPITVLYIAEQLAAQYTTNAQVKNILDKVRFHISPESNPDGYVFSWTNDRMWRKNRRNNGNSYGVDLNRNFNTHWGESGSSRTPTSDTYQGPSPCSEPECQALSKYFTNLKCPLGGIDYHAYGELVLRSWGWTVNPSSDESWLKPMGDAWRDAIARVNNVVYTSQRAGELYPASGCTDDYMSDTIQAFPGHGWTVELRSKNSFILPPAQITPTGAENFAGALNLLDQLLRRFGDAPKCRS